MPHELKRAHRSQNLVVAGVEKFIFSVYRSWTVGLPCSDAADKFLRPSCGKGGERHCVYVYIPK